MAAAQRYTVDELLKHQAATTSLPGVHKEVAAEIWLEQPHAQTAAQERERWSKQFSSGGNATFPSRQMRNPQSYAPAGASSALEASLSPPTVSPVTHVNKWLYREGVAGSVSGPSSWDDVVSFVDMGLIDEETTQMCLEGDDNNWMTFAVVKDADGKIEPKKKLQLPSQPQPQSQPVANDSLADRSFGTAAAFRPSTTKPAAESWAAARARKATNISPPPPQRATGTTSQKPREGQSKAFWRTGMDDAPNGPSTTPPSTSPPLQPVDRERKAPELGGQTVEAPSNTSGLSKGSAPDDKPRQSAWGPPPGKGASDKPVAPFAITKKELYQSPTVSPAMRPQEAPNRDEFSTLSPRGSRIPNKAPPPFAAAVASVHAAGGKTPVLSPRHGGSPKHGAVHHSSPRQHQPHAADTAKGGAGIHHDKTQQHSGTQKQAHGQKVETHQQHATEAQRKQQTPPPQQQQQHQPAAHGKEHAAAGKHPEKADKAAPKGNQQGSGHDAPKQQQQRQEVSKIGASAAQHKEQKVTAKQQQQQHAHAPYKMSNEKQHGAMPSMEEIMAEEQRAAAEHPVEVKPKPKKGGNMWGVQPVMKPAGSLEDIMKQEQQSYGTAAKDEEGAASAAPAKAAPVVGGASDKPSQQAKSKKDKRDRRRGRDSIDKGETVVATGFQDPAILSVSPPRDEEKGPDASAPKNTAEVQKFFDNAKKQQQQPQPKKEKAKDRKNNKDKGGSAGQPASAAPVTDVTRVDDVSPEATSPKDDSSKEAGKKTRRGGRRRSGADNTTDSTVSPTPSSPLTVGDADSVPGSNKSNNRRQRGGKGGQQDSERRSSNSGSPQYAGNDNDQHAVQGPVDGGDKDGARRRTRRGGRGRHGGGGDDAPAE